MTNGSVALDERARLEERIRRDRAELAAAVVDLGHAARDRLRLGAHVADEPAAWLLGAFTLGLWLGWREGA